MRKRWLIAALALCAILVLALPTAASARSSRSSRPCPARNEITDDGMRGVGDPDGGGSFTAVIDGRELCYGIAVKDIGDPVAAHIHKGGKNKNGPVVIPLDAPHQRGSGLLQRVRDDQGQALRARSARHPGRYYVNIHNANYPDGAARGQLFARSP